MSCWGKGLPFFPQDKKTMDSNRIDLLKRRSDNLSINVNIQHVEKKTQSVSARAAVVVGFFFFVFTEISIFRKSKTLDI